MLENEMEESLSGTIKICDVSYDALRAFVNYLYTAEACLDEQMACDLLVLAEKYQVKHLKTYCEKFMVSKLNWENALVSFAFAHQHNAKNLVDSALSLIMDNMDKLSKREEYLELVEKDPRLVVEIYEAYLSKQVNTAAHKDSLSKPWQELDCCCCCCFNFHFSLSLFGHGKVITIIDGDFWLSKQGIIDPNLVYNMLKKKAMIVHNKSHPHNLVDGFWYWTWDLLSSVLVTSLYYEMF